VTKSPRSVLAAALLAALITVFVSAPASAQDPVFVHGNLSWEKDLVFASPTQTKIRVRLVAGYQGSSVGPIAVGNVLALATLHMTGAGGYSSAHSPSMVVTSVNGADDYFVAAGTVELILDNANLPLLVTYSGCCRLASLMDGNGSTPFQLKMIVTANSGTPPTSRSPTTTLLPRVFATQGQTLSFQIPSQAYEGFTNTFQVSHHLESGLVSSTPSSTVPANLFNLSSTGLVTWTPAASGLYAVQVQIDSRDATSLVRASVPVEFIIQVLPPCLTCAVVTVAAPPTVMTAVGADMAATVSVTTTSTNPASQAELQHTPLASGMHIRKLTSGKTATWQVSWTPRPGQSPSFVCFQGYDTQTGTSSFGSACTQWIIQPAQVMTLTGMLRTFSPSHPDMNRPLNEATSADFVAQALGADLKPVQISAAPGVTKFNEWFTDVPSVNQTVVHSTWLSNALQMDPGIYGFQSMDWQPAEGEKFFTYEAHGSFVYHPGAMLSFKSAGDMWVFINRALPAASNLHGVHASKTLNVLLDTMGLTPGASYPIDIFYAHRGATTIPSIQLQQPIEAPIPASSIVFDVPVGGFAAGVADTLGSASVSGGELRLVTNQSMPNSAGAGWLMDDHHLTNGFTLDFSFIGTQSLFNSGEGFAAIVAASPAVGAAGGGLGYDGIPSSVAVEFDAKQSPGSGDPAYQHIAAHTRGVAPNSAVESSHLFIAPSVPDLQNAFFNATAQRVRVDYRPVTEQPIGWLRVWMNDNLLPALESLVDRASFNALFGGGRGMVGFTAATGSNTSSVSIRSLRLTTYPGVNLPPSIDGGLISADEGIAIDVQFQVEDPERQPITASMTGLPAGLSFSYTSSNNGPGPEATIRVFGTPAPGTGGIHHPTLTLSDGTNVVEPPFTIVIDAPPRITAVVPNFQLNEDAPSQLLDTSDYFADPTQQDLEYSVESDQSWLTTSLQPGPDRVVFQPVADANGTATLTIRATDTDGHTTQQIFTVTVSPVNDPPTLGQIAPVSVVAGTSASVALSHVTPGPADEMGQAIEIVTVSSDPASTGVIAHAAGVLTLSPPLRSTTVTVNVTVTVREVAEPSSAVSRTFAVTITGVEPPPPPPPGIAGRMHGQVGLAALGNNYDVHFKVAEKEVGVERGSLHIKISAPRSGNKKASANRFESTAITAIAFSDDPAFTSGKSKKAPIVDTVVFSGTGEWNGGTGYRFEARATDQGEPGPGRDRFAFTIYDPANAVVATIDAVIASGNIQSSRLKR